MQDGYHKHMLKQNNFVGAKIGGKIGVSNGNNKLNSFRGGPVRATVNVIDQTNSNFIN